MDRKQVLIVSLLLVAIVLSSVSVIMNVTIMSEVGMPSLGVSDAPSANVGIEILPTEINGGEVTE